MNWNEWIRKTHRRLAITFTIVVAAIFVALGLGEKPAQWVYYVPLPFLGLLMLSGLYLFVLPHAEKWFGGGGRANG